VKKGISIAIGIVITIIVLVLGVSWIVGNESKIQQPLTPITNSTVAPVGKNYVLNLTENVGIHAK
jgi:uncharacterized protein YggT (Ycf19 family)